MLDAALTSSVWILAARSGGPGYAPRLRASIQQGRRAGGRNLMSGSHPVRAAGGELPTSMGVSSAQAATSWCVHPYGGQRPRAHALMIRTFR